MKNSVEIKEIDRNIINIIKEIAPLCGNLYLVGGALRDILNGVKPDDYDILTDYPTDSIIEKIKRNHKVKIARIENRINPLIRLDIDNGNILDLSTLQGQLSDNLSTRDFTVNSLAISINELIKYDKTEIIDLFGGIEHAQHRILFPTTELSLKADPLRILRAFRIKLYKDYIFSETLSLDMKKHRKLIANVKGERLWMELKKILNHPDSYPVFSEIVNGKFLDDILVGVEKMRNFEHNKAPAKTLLEHSLYTYKRLEEFLNRDAKRLLGNIDYFNIPILKLSAFLHDIGKLYTKRYINEQELHFYNHEIIGAKISKDIVKEKLSFSNINAKYVEILVANHMRPHLFTKIGKLSDHAIYRFVRDSEGHPEDVITLSIADALSTNSKIDKLLYVASQVNDYIEKNSKNKIEALLNGKEIMELLSISPSKVIGEIKEQLIKEQINGFITSKEEAKYFVLKKFGNLHNELE